MDLPLLAKSPAEVYVSTSDGEGVVYRSLGELHARLGYVYLQYAAKAQDETEKTIFARRAMDVFSSAKELGAGAQASLGMSMALTMAVWAGLCDPVESKWMSDRAISEAEEAVASDPGNHEGHSVLAEALMTKAARCRDAELASLVQRAMMSAEVAHKLRYGYGSSNGLAPRGQCSVGPSTVPLHATELLSHQVEKGHRGEEHDRCCCHYP